MPILPLCIGFSGQYWHKIFPPNSGVFTFYNVARKHYVLILQYYDCKYNIYSILMSNLKYFPCKTTMSVIMAFKNKYFQCKANVKVWILTHIDISLELQPITLAKHWIQYKEHFLMTMLCKWGTPGILLTYKFLSYSQRRRQALSPFWLSGFPTNVKLLYYEVRLQSSQGWCNYTVCFFLWLLLIRVREGIRVHVKKKLVENLTINYINS